MGSFTFDTDDYIVEARWRADPTDRGDGDIFAKKVERKGKNAVGLQQWRAQADQKSAGDDSILGVYIGRYSDFLALSGPEFAAQVGLDNLRGQTG